jgi:hypothetical protein
LKKTAVPAIILLVICSLVFQDYYSKTQAAVIDLTQRNTISYVQPMHDDYKVMKSTGVDEAYIYDIRSSDKSIKHIEYWVEHYKDGSFNGRLIQSGSDMIPNQEMRISISRTDINEKLEMWNVSHLREENSGWATMVSAVNEFQLAASNSILQKEEIIKDKELNLSAVIRNKAGNSITLLGSMEDLIQNNDEVFIFKCRFV